MDDQPMDQASLPLWKRTTTRIAAALALITLLAYARLPANDFVGFDDQAYIVLNPIVKDGLTWSGLKLAWSIRPHESGNWHPITWMSHMLDCQLFGLRPAWHHAVNLALHLANVVLLFVLLARMTSAVWPSAAVAALFALHPLAVESVAWAAERKNVLSTLFWLLSTAAYVRYGFTDGWRRWVWYGAALGLFAIGLCTKPMLVTLPVTLLLWDFWPLGRSGWVGFPDSREESSEFFDQWWLLLAEKIPFFCLSAVSAALTIWVQAPARTGFDVLPLGVRLSTMAVGYVAYLGRFAWPLELAVLYPLDLGGPPLWQVAGAVLLLAGVTLAAAWPLRDRPYVLMGWCWYLVTMLPVSGILQVGRHATADRYTYVPLVGIYLVVVWGASELAGRFQLRRWPLAVGAGLVLAMLGGITAYQVGVWRNQLTLFQHALDVGAESAEAHFNVAVEYYLETKRRGTHDRVTDEQIRRHLERAVKLAPDELKPRLHLAQVLLKQGRLSDGLAQFDAAVRIDPKSADARFGRAMLQYALQHYAESIEDFQETLRLDPGHPDAHYNLAKALMRIGRTGEGLRHMRQTTSLRAEDILARDELAQIALQLRRPEEAVQLYQDIVRLRPELPEAHYQLGLYLQIARRPAEATEAYRAALRLQPNFAAAANNLAWVLATDRLDSVRSGAEAVEWAELACRLSDSQNASYLDTLAAAYAEAGQFDRAVSTAERSVELAISQGRVDQATKVQERLNLYRGGQPFRQATS